MESWKLSNNIKVIFTKTCGAKVCSIEIFTPVSVINENKNNSGISYLTAKLMIQSTKNRSNEILAEDIENIGAGLTANADYDTAGFSANCLTEYFQKMTEILSDVLLNPKFNENELEFEKQNVLAALLSRKDSIGKTASDEFAKIYYNNTSYANPVLGNPSAVQKITVQNLKDWHRFSYNAENIIISAAGNIDKSTVCNFLEKYFSGIPNGEKFQLPSLNLNLPNEQKKEIDGKFNQAYIFAGFPAPDILNKDTAAVKLASAVLGGRMTSRLFIELREKLGLAYEVNTVFPSRKKQSYFAVYIGLDKKNIKLTLEKIDEILKNFCDVEVSQQELRDTKNYIKGLYVIDRQTVSKKAYYLGWREAMGQGYEYENNFLQNIEEVTSKDIIDVSNKIFKSKALTVIINPANF
jgi:predicted Zn-dependent peptidase